MDDSTAVYEAAGAAYDWFETATRGDDGEAFTRHKEGVPEWVQDLTMSAHGDFLPDDWRYECIRAALGWIHDNEPKDVEDAHEFADDYVDIYTIARFQWLASHIDRQFYVDDAAEEFGWDDGRGVADLIGLGQYQEASEVYSLVVRALQEHIEQRDNS